MKISALRSNPRLVYTELVAADIAYRPGRAAGRAKLEEPNW
jgi:hypothetical protein